MSLHANIERMRDVLNDMRPISPCLTEQMERELDAMASLAGGGEAVAWLEWDGYGIAYSWTEAAKKLPHGRYDLFISPSASSLNEEYTRGRCDGFEAARHPAGDVQVDEAMVIRASNAYFDNLPVHGGVAADPVALEAALRAVINPGAVQVTDEMVERALAALEEAAEGEDGRNLIWQNFGTEAKRLDVMRAAITAALNPGGSRE